MLLTLTRKPTISLDIWGNWEVDYLNPLAHGSCRTGCRLAVVPLSLITQRTTFVHPCAAQSQWPSKLVRLSRVRATCRPGTHLTRIATSESSPRQEGESLEMSLASFRADETKTPGRFKRDGYDSVVLGQKMAIN